MARANSTTLRLFALTLFFIFPGAHGASPKESENRSLDVSTVCNGRLTLTSGTPITTAEVSSSGTIYFTPYRGNKVALYDGAAWKLYSFTERSLALSISADTNYDVFIYNNSGTLTLELSAAWTGAGAQTRTDALTLQDGVYVKSGATTRRYLGTIRGSGANVTADSNTKRFVWNYNFRVPRILYITPAMATWSYIGTWRAAQGDTAHKVETVVGIAESFITLRLHSLFYTTGCGYVGICEDCSNTASVGETGNYGHTGIVGNQTQVLQASFRRISAIGYHYYTWTEAGCGAGAGVFYGANESGMSGYIEG